LDIQEFKAVSGEKIFLFGPSGSGKSTLLSLIAGVLSPERGSLKILANELAGMKPSSKDRLRADHIGFIFQQFNLVPYLSVIDNVLLSCHFSNSRSKKATERGGTLRADAERLLRELDLLPDHWNKSVSQLSVGQQQRVAAARALIGEPELIIADEPTSALDAQRQVAFLDLLGSECKKSNSTLLFVSHDIRLADAFDRVVDLTAINTACFIESKE
jgi:putative ABC transport system ATP-binding protein